MKQRWFIEQKKQHVAAWWASGLTRQQYCELNDIPFTSLREWPEDVANLARLHPQKDSMRSKLKQAGWSNKFRSEIIFD